MRLEFRYNDQCDLGLSIDIDIDIMYYYEMQRVNMRLSTKKQPWKVQFIFLLKNRVGKFQYVL